MFKPGSAAKLAEKIKSELGLTPNISTETEFYLTGGDAKHDTDVLALVLTGALQKDITPHSMDKENGERQYELVTDVTTDIPALLKQTKTLRELLQQSSKNFKMNPKLGAKPFDDQPGNGMHIHLSLKDSDGNNVFVKADAKKNKESDPMRFAIGGLLASMAEATLIFAPEAEDYARYDSPTNENDDDDNPFRRVNHAPTHICWGGNNRTAAIRIPSSTLHKDQRHLEHRVASPSADTEQVLCAILAGVHFGLKNRVEPLSDKLYGNAFDDQYNLPRLPQSLEEAEIAFDNGKILKKYF